VPPNTREADGAVLLWRPSICERSSIAPRLTRVPLGWAPAGTTRVFAAVRGYLRAALHTRATNREFRRIGVSEHALEVHSAAIDAATPAFAQTRGKPWAEVGDASAALLELLRRVPTSGGVDALLNTFLAAGDADRAAPSGSLIRR